MEMLSPQCRVLVVKVASRCNLNCTYCYMYNMGDESFRGRPKVMSDEVLTALMQRILNHCTRHNINEFLIILHGGEPLLCGMDFYHNMKAIEQAVIGEAVKIVYTVQTNGTLLSEEWCHLFASLGFSAGVSMDGNAVQNDRFRIDHAGRGSYHRIVAGLQLLQQHPVMKYRTGVLSVISIDNDPNEVYDHFKQLKVPVVNFLLPDANYDKLPPAAEDAVVNAQETPYGNWLCTLFDRWYADKEGRPTISIFSNIIQSLLGNDVGSETIGNLNNEVLVIETDGSIESVDTLRICGNGITIENVNVLDTELDDAFDKPLIRLYYQAHEKLCTRCMNCPVVETCGGGYLPHRYSAGNSFNNPSVYCKDLARLIIHIQNRVFADLPEELVREGNIQLVVYDEVMQAIMEADHSTASPYAAELEKTY